MRPTIDPKKIQALFPIRNARISRDDHVVYKPCGEAEEYVIPLTIVDKTGIESSDIVSFTIPRPQSDGVFEINGTYKVIINEGRPNFEYPNEDCNTLHNMTMRTYHDIVLDKVAEALESGIRSWFYGNNLDIENIQQILDTFYANDEMFRQVNPDKNLEVLNFQECIYLKLPNTEFNIDRIIPYDWKGFIDPLSTPQSGDKICRIYRLNADVHVSGRKIRDDLRGDNIQKHNLNGILERNGIFLENGRRHLQITSNIASHEELVDWDSPVCTYNYYANELKGIHLKTVVMATKYNFGDAIQISESAAKRLRCKVKSNITFTSHGLTFFNVKEGDYISPTSCSEGVATVVEKIAGEEKAIKVMPRGLKSEALVRDISEFKTKQFGKPAKKYRITLESEYEMEDGDKMTTRHGSTKGVVCIVPDAEMPHYKDHEGNLVPTEVVMTPYGIMSRRSFGIIREMLVNKLIIEEEQLENQVFDHFGEDLTIQSILDESPQSCEKEQFYLNGEPLEHKSFSGPLYFLRQDKHARDAAIAISGAVLNHKMFKKDNSFGGQKFTNAIYEMLVAKGAREISDFIMTDNCEPMAQMEMDSMMKALEWCEPQQTEQQLELISSI